MNNVSGHCHRRKVLGAISCALASVGDACQPAAPAQASPRSRAPSVEVASSQGASGPSVNAAAPRVGAPSGTTSNAASDRAPQGGQKPAASAEETLAVMIDSGFPSLMTDEAKRRLAHVGDVSENRLESAGIVDFAVRTRGRQFLVEYIHDSTRGAWIFNHATAEVSAADAGAAAALYAEHDRVLRQRFGKPAWVAAEDEPPVAGWSIGDMGMEVSLRQQRDERGMYVIRIHFGEVQGEAE
jgi:hypothetical protein